MQTRANNTYSLIKYFLNAYPKESSLAILALLLAGFAETLGIGALLPLITIIIEGDAVPDNRLAASIFQIFEFLGIAPSLPNLLLTIVITISTKAAIIFQAMRYVSYVATDVTRNFRLKLIDALMHAQWNYFSSLSIGKISNTISSEAARAGHCYLLFGRTLAAFVQSIIYVLAAFLVSWQVSLIAATMGLLVAILLKRFITMSRNAGADLTQYMNQMIGQLNESLSGIKPLKAMGQEKPYIDQLDHYTTQVMKAQKKQALSNLLMQIVYEPIAVILLAAGLFYILSYTVTPIASVILLAFLFYRLLTNANLLQSFYQNMVQNESAVWGLIKETDEAKANKESLNQGSIPQFKKQISIENISISYDGSTTILKDFSAIIPKNKLTVLFGPSGVGKTSIIDSLLGLINLHAGDIKIDDNNLSAVDTNAWRARIGYVPQDTFLFHDSIENNITLSSDDFDTTMIETTLNQAGAADFIKSIPDGIKSTVGERGGKLSGGQRQRIALARAIIRRPDILILDESTSGLDEATENQILETLKDISKEITIIMISHNPKILEIADNVINLGKEKQD